ncbi:MAG TPA: hypothetical protein VG755_19010 [Nannocystaceae bacterium]|nr:hypothetical protein [Nannocystaceae bacterium]
MDRRAFFIAFALCACSGDDDGAQVTASSSTASTSSAGSSSEGETTTETGATTTTATTATSNATTVADESTSSSSDGGATFDLGVQPDVGRSGPGCTAVDFLFVVDDSSSMSEHQANLVANFPTFIAGIESTLGEVDSFHVGVIATDAFSGNPGACILLGALITETTGAGADSSNAVCGPYAEGLGYMTEADDLDSTFACAAQVGTMGNGFERPMEAMVTALGPSLAGVGQCNEGFLRDDALLVIVVITDEWDGPGDPEDLGGSEDPPTSLGDPQSWHDDVVAAKGGMEENVAALAITNYAGGPCVPADDGHDGQNIVEWVNLFGNHGFTGGICLDDYGDFVEDAVDVVAQACADFTPEG